MRVTLLASFCPLSFLVVSLGEAAEHALLGAFLPLFGSPPVCGKCMLSAAPTNPKGHRVQPVR